MSINNMIKYMWDFWAEGMSRTIIYLYDDSYHDSLTTPSPALGYYHHLSLIQNMYHTQSQSSLVSVP